MAAQQGLPAGASSATLTSNPPAACCCSRRSRRPARSSVGFNANFTQCRASKSSCTDGAEDPRSTKPERTESTVAPTPRPPQGHAVRCRDTGRARPAARWLRPPARPKNPTPTTTVPRHISAGTPEEGSKEQQVQYSFYCNGPITGYQLQSQIPVTGIQSPPMVTLERHQSAAEGHVLVLGRSPRLRAQLRRPGQGRLRDDHRPVRDRTRSSAPSRAWTRC